MSLLWYVFFWLRFSRISSDLLDIAKNNLVHAEERIYSTLANLTTITEEEILPNIFKNPLSFLDELTYLYENLSFIEDENSLATAKNPFVYLEELNYYYENHTVVTEDGYCLLLVRISYDRNESVSNTFKPAILFVHGLESSFNDFLVAGPGESFGFKAVEEGYDVFLLNTRGNRWSRSHTTLDPDLNADAFWNFSFHEIGFYDVPATIDYILNVTGQSKVSYVGHSQGTTAFLAFASTRPEYNDKITLAVLLAPVAFNGNSTLFAVVSLGYNVDLMQAAAETLHLNEFVPYNATLSQLGKNACSPNSPILWACKKFVYEFLGPTGQLNASVVSAAFVNFPAGASVKEAIHYEQNAKTGKFRMYNYLGGRNLIEYGQSTPPDYNLKAVTAPVALYYGSNDYLAVISDVEKLIDNLPNVVENVLISSVETNHLDTLIGARAKELIFQPALDVLNKYNNL